MKNLTKLSILFALSSVLAFGQLNSLVQTSLSAAITAKQTTFAVAAATGINGASASVPGSALYIVDPGQIRGELVNVISISSTTVTVRRADKATPHVSSAMVLVATAPNWFYSVDPVGSCVTASVYASPYLNVTNGAQWLCSAKTLSWVPGWGNPYGSPAVLSGTATASVAGATAVAGPLIEISGTNAITSFTMSVGWNGNPFCVVPTGAYTTTATNNIAKASTGVSKVQQCWVWDANISTASFVPSY